MSKLSRKTRFCFVLTLVVALIFVLSMSALALAETKIDPKDVFLKMPTAADLTKEYDGKQPAWVDFAYDINPVPTLWVNDKSMGEDGLGLVYLDIYRWSEETKAYEPYDLGRYPGNMEGAGFNMDKAGFFNYGPPYGEKYYSLKTVYVGKYKATWLVPIYGTNTEDFNTYEYVEYSVEFEIKPPGLFTAVPELSRDADGKAVEAPKPAYDLKKVDYKGDATKVTTKEYWYEYAADAEHFAGKELKSAPQEIGLYVYRLQVTDGDKLDENIYVNFELTDPDYVEPFFRTLGDAIFDLPPTDPSKVYDGKPVTFDDMNIKYDVARSGKKGGNEWYELIWYEPNRYGSYTNSIGELQGSKTGPSEPGTYNFQFGVHGDDELEGFIYVKFTISEAPGKKATEFTDVKSTDWFCEAVQYALDHKLFEGVSATSFAPQSAMTRGMMATVLYRMAGEPEVAAAELSDVVADTWYTKAAAWAASNDILLATDKAFKPDAPVTREQMAYALRGYAKLQQKEITGAADLTSFSDGAKVSDWAKDAMAWSVEAKLFEGKDATTLDPLAGATRAEVATLLMRFCENTLK